MENPSDPEQRSPDPGRPTIIRPPGLEFAMGMGIFGVIFSLFFVMQSLVFLRTAAQVRPDLGLSGFSFAQLQDPQIQDALNELGSNGDIIGPTAFWAGLLCSVLLLVFCYLWRKGPGFRSLLGLRGARPLEYLKWMGMFAVLMGGIELLGYFFPAFRSVFMTDVLGSTTDRLMLLLGVGLMAPIFEELLLRGLALGSLRFIADKHVAVALTAGAFTLMHFQYDAVIMLLILPMGILLGYARTNTGSIFVPIAMHMLNNLLSVLLPSWY